VFNLHSHACPLYSAAKLLGLEFTARGFEVNLRLPVEAFRLESPLVGVIKQAKGKFEGWYEPAHAGSWTISFSLDPADAVRLTSAEVNGKRSKVAVTDGRVTLEGKGGPGSPVRWKLG
jgi:hypothetical protein